MHRAILHEMLQLKTAARRSVIDLTDDIELLIMKHHMLAGAIHVKALHTTARVVEQENEPQLHEDWFDNLDEVASPDGHYRHDQIGTLRTVNVCDGECQNGWAHIQALRLPPNVTVHVFEGKRIKGLWDRVLLVELDRARDRTVSVLLDGEFEDSKPVVDHTEHHPAMQRATVG